MFFIVIFGGWIYLVGITGTIGIIVISIIKISLSTYPALKAFAFIVVDTDIVIGYEYIALDSVGSVSSVVYLISAKPVSNETLLKYYPGELL